MEKSHSECEACQYYDYHQKMWLNAIVPMCRCTLLKIRDAQRIDRKYTDDVIYEDDAREVNT